MGWGRMEGEGGGVDRNTVVFDLTILLLLLLLYLTALQLLHLLDNTANTTITISGNKTSKISNRSSSF